MPVIRPILDRRSALALACGAGLGLALGSGAAHADIVNTNFWGTAVHG